ncbi:MAG: FAD-dependent oxidoreductase [Myxococcales bacterium FL481]|nr:MAG: FAD-dependent oxidoreductase [Myxococcales bacterium FL481]
MAISPPKMLGPSTSSRRTSIPVARPRSARSTGSSPMASTSHSVSGEGPAVVVCGAGAAGISTAIAAARAGGRVCLVESNPSIGGTVAGALIHTLAGFYDSSGEALNDGIAFELLERLLAAGAWRRRMGRVWVLQVDPQVYQHVAQHWLASLPNIDIQLGARVTRVHQYGARVRGVEIHSHEGTRQIDVRSLVDTTGGGRVVALLEPSLVDHDDTAAAGGWVFRLRNVAPDAMAFPRGIGVVRSLRDAAASGSLPRDCAKAWVDVGLTPDEVYVKLFVPLPPSRDRTDTLARVVRRCENDQSQVLAHLRTLPGFRDATPHGEGGLGVRDDGRVRGEYQLTRDDVKALRKFDDVAARCAWPIEYWDREHGVVLDYLDPGEYYEIPRRSLRVAGVDNLWAAGKCLSADRYAQASARVVGACWAMGEAAGSHAVADGN